MHMEKSRKKVCFSHLRHLMRAACPIVLHNMSDHHFQYTTRHLPRSKRGSSNWMNHDGAAVDPKLAKDVAQFFDVCNKQHASEREMSKNIISILDTLFGVKFTDHVRTRNRTTESDAIATANTLDGHRAIISHAEFKQYLGIDGASELQNTLTVRMHQVLDEVRGSSTESNRIRLRYSMRQSAISQCPCLHISIAGPYIQFTGSVLVDIFISQPFTTFLYLGPDPNRTERMYQPAHIISIFKDGVTTLQKHYQEMTTSTTTELARLFSDPTYRTQDLVDPRLVFKERYRFHGWTTDVFSLALFRAELGNESVLVKFSERYCIEAHSLLAEKQPAPAIRYFGWLKGGMAMIIMEELKGTTAQQQWPNPENIADTVLADVKKAKTICTTMASYIVTFRVQTSLCVRRSRTTANWSCGRAFLTLIGVGKTQQKTQPPRISQTFNVKGIGTPVASVKE